MGGDDELRGGDEGAVLDYVAGDGGEGDEGLGGDGFQAGDLRGEGGLVAAGFGEDLLAGDGVGLGDGVVGTVCCAVSAVQAQGDSSSEVGLGDGAGDEVVANDGGR